MEEDNDAWNFSNDGECDAQEVEGSGQAESVSSRDEEYDQKQLEKNAELREHLKTRLVGAKAAMNIRYEANDCPVEPIENFFARGLMGKGGQPAVFEVNHRTSFKLYALKVVRKQATE